MWTFIRIINHLVETGANREDDRKKEHLMTAITSPEKSSRGLLSLRWMKTASIPLFDAFCCITEINVHQIPSSIDDTPPSHACRLSKVYTHP